MFKNFKVALNPMYRIFFKLCQKFHLIQAAYQNPIFGKIFTSPILCVAVLYANNCFIVLFDLDNFMISFDW